jgi:RNase adaptor protein for sRNA GlmZ degradation
MLRLISFGFKHGGPPPEALTVVDCRHLRNPHHVSRLRPLDGRHDEVKAFVWQSPGFPALMNLARPYIGTGQVTLAFGCHGGRHRSVAMAEIVAQYARDEGEDVVVEHYALVGA